MDPRIVAICTAQGGVASVSELRAAGISSEIHRVVAKKELVRVRQRVVSPAAVSRPGPASRRWTRTPSAGGTGLRGHSCRSRSLGRSRRASLARTGVREVVELADGGSQSAGESRSRWLLHTLGSGPFITQFPVRAGGLLLGTTDLRLRRWDVVVEFDGRGKYGQGEFGTDTVYGEQAARGPDR